MKKRGMLVGLMTIVGLLVMPLSSSADESVVPIGTLKPAVHLDKPQLYPTGGKLLLSDSPETYTQDGAFYRDVVTGDFRVFWHHQNRSGETRSVALALTNTSNQTVQIFTKAVGLSVNYYPDVAGQEALKQFISNQSKKHFVTTLKPGESYYLVKKAADLDTVSGIAEFVVYNKYGHSQGTVTATTLNYLSEHPAHPETMPILKGDTHIRGTFPHENRVGLLKDDLSNGSAYIRLSSAATGKWSDKLPGEYETGVDVVDGNKPVINNGNYGVIYNLEVVVKNSLHSPQTLKVYDNPSGGAGHYVMKWNNQIQTSGYLNYLNAWQFAQETVGANSGVYHIETSLPGGASGPQVIYFKPGSAQ